MKPTTVRSTQSLDSSTVVDVLALAFHQDPVARWFYPKTGDYLSAFPQFIRAFGGAAFSGQTAWTTDDLSGAALWHAPGVKGDDAALIRHLETSIDADRLGSVLALIEQMDQHHPVEPHWYLPMIGVDPQCQGRGHGSALLRHALAICDQDHLPVYLESSNPANLSLYHRHGFEISGAIHAGDSPPLFTMTRPAH